MKKIPLAIIPLILFIIFILVFLFIPADQDLISSGDDYILGGFIVQLFVLFLSIDIIRFRKKIVAWLSATRFKKK